MPSEYDEDKGPPFPRDHPAIGDSTTAVRVPEETRGWYVVHARVTVPTGEERPRGHLGAGQTHDVTEGYAASSEREARMVARHHIARKYNVSTTNVHIDSVERQ